MSGDDDGFRSKREFMDALRVLKARSGLSDAPTDYLRAEYWTIGQPTASGQCGHRPPFLTAARDVT